MRYQAIIFDLFGTLIENYTVHEYDGVLAEMAAVVLAPRDEFVALWQQTFRERAIGTIATTEANIIYVCGTLGVNPDASQIAAAAHMRQELTRRVLHPAESTLKALKELKSKGYKIGLVSDCSSEVPLLWSTTALAPLIEAPVFSCAVGLKKPDTRIYQLACNLLGVQPEACIYVGDGSSRELSGALSVGMYPVLIRSIDDDESDAYRIEAEDWQGARILRLKDIFELLE